MIFTFSYAMKYKSAGDFLDTPINVFQIVKFDMNAHYTLQLSSR